MYLLCFKMCIAIHCNSLYRVHSSRIRGITLYIIHKLYEAMCVQRALWVYEFRQLTWIKDHLVLISDSKIHGANMGPSWVLPAPGGPHVGPMNLAIWVCCSYTHRRRFSLWDWNTRKISYIQGWKQVMSTPVKLHTTVYDLQQLTITRKRFA